MESTCCHRHPTTTLSEVPGLKVILLNYLSHIGWPLGLGTLLIDWLDEDIRYSRPLPIWPEAKKMICLYLEFHDAGYQESLCEMRRFRTEIVKIDTWTSLSISELEGNLVTWSRFLLLSPDVPVSFLVITIQYYSQHKLTYIIVTRNCTCKPFKQWKLTGMHRVKWTVVSLTCCRLRTSRLDGKVQPLFH